MNLSGRKMGIFANKRFQEIRHVNFPGENVEISHIMRNIYSNSHAFVNNDFTVELPWEFEIFPDWIETTSTDDHLKD
jgi:hypothetical protein